MSVEAAALGNWVSRAVLTETSLGSLLAPVCYHTRGAVFCRRIQDGFAYESEREKENVKCTKTQRCMNLEPYSSV
jgi:hypothetical protein